MHSHAGPIASHPELQLSDDYKGSHVESYTTALHNQLTDEEVDEYLDSNPRPIFVYDYLMFPKLLRESVLALNTSSEDLAYQMTPATLLGHLRLSTLIGDEPQVLQSELPGHNVAGFVVFGLTDSQHVELAKRHESLYVKNDAEAVIELEVQDSPDGLPLEGATRKVPVSVYVWDRRKWGTWAFLPTIEHEWRVSKFMQSSWWKKLASPNIQRLQREWMKERDHFVVKKHERSTSLSKWVGGENLGERVGNVGMLDLSTDET
ncbi:MAG: hypothetical protein M1824_000045 [Vezdaea acicularis]|nr:MAG: hypothetical protein M1824_000045 [Vezdaea acicularis]